MNRKKHLYVEFYFTLKQKFCQKFFKGISQSFPSKGFISRYTLNWELIFFFPFQTLRCQKKKKTLDIERERKREREEERETRLTEIKRNKRQLMNIRTRQSHCKECKEHKRDKE